MRRLLVLFTLASLALGQKLVVRNELRTPQVHATKGRSAAHSKPPSKNRRGTSGILYHNGPLMLGTPTVYFIWYGSWAPLSAEVPILTDFVKSIGGSPYEAVNASYFDGKGIHVSGQVGYGGSTFDSYSHGKNLSDADVQAIVSEHLGKPFPVDANALYFVLTSDDVSESSGLFTQYCGWHNAATINGQLIKFSLVGNPAPNFISGCAEQAVGPNGSSGADAMASVIAHEMEEAISDPDQTGWYFRTGNENADQCAWKFGATYVGANGAMANMRLGARDFLIQQNWLNSGGGSCVLVPSSTSRFKEALHQVRNLMKKL